MISDHIKTGVIVVLLLFLSFHSVRGQNTNTLIFSINEDELTISSLDQTLLLYRFRSVPAKPYIKFLTSPNGINVLRDAPYDHLHHHGLMFAFKVNDTDFWIEKETTGRQIHTSFQDIDVSIKNKNTVATFTQAVDWIDSQAKKILLNEKRVLSLTQSEKVTLLTWSAILKTARDIHQVKITGSHYHGLGMRFVQSMDQNGTFMNSADKTGDIFRGTERLTQARWCAYHAIADSNSVTVAMFNHPDNSQPVTWFTMTQPFSYLSATLKYHDNTYILKSADDLSLTYGIAVWDGEKDKATIEQVYHAWLKQITCSGDKK